MTAPTSYEQQGTRYDAAAVGYERQGRAVNTFPAIALSVRQPWAWAIIHAGKDIENRSWQPNNLGIRKRGRVAIHASKGMTRAEYADAAAFMKSIGITCPTPGELSFGGIVGSAEIVDVVRHHDSPWFFGPLGLVLRKPEATSFATAAGQLGFFRWEKPALQPAPAPAARGALF
jgi:hypothetical protein